MPKISVIVATYNSASNIEPCLDSLVSQDLKDYEAIVVDNCSSDGTRDIVKKKYPGFRLVENPVNYGISKSWNQGIAQAQAQYICCINDDVRLCKDFLSVMHRAIEEDSLTGAIQPKVLQPGGRRIDSVGISLSFLRRYRDIGSGKKDSQKYSAKKPIFGACDAAALYRREALQAVWSSGEYFDEDFFCLVEDVDLSWRMQKAGWQAFYCPEAICTHSRGLSRRKSSVRRYLNLRNRYLMIIKNESVAGLVRLPIVFLAYDLWRALFMLATDPKCLFSAICDTARLLPKMLRKRRGRAL